MKEVYKVKNKTIIIGGGISGMFSALFLLEKKKIKGEDILIIEKNSEVGGLLRKYDYGANGVFDYGMHNMLETGVEEMDRMQYSWLPDEDEWQILEGNNRDLCGSYYRGVLQKHTPYFDLRALPKEEYTECLLDFLSNMDHNDKYNTQVNNARDYAIARFGKVVAEKTVIPSIEKIHKMKAKDLDPLATFYTPMSRITVFNEDLMHDILSTEKLRDRLAFPEQRNLPLNKSTGKKGFYPRNYGIHKVIDSMRKRLEAKNVKFLLESQIKSIDIQDDVIYSMCVEKNSEKSVVTDIRDVLWTAGLPVLGTLLGLDYSGLKFDEALNTIPVNILLDKKLEIDDLYYFYCYDNGLDTFRLTNYINYSSNAKRNGGYPICIELLLEKNKTPDKETLEQKAINELKRFNIMAPDTNILFVSAEILESGFPRPSVNNITSLDIIRKQIEDISIKNLHVTGILAEKNLFFQAHVLRDAHKKVSSF